jgi:hypothetical protein
MAQSRTTGNAPAPHAAPGQPRRVAIQAARGAALAVHSAAGLAMQVSKEAERLLRAAEGLTRAAAAVLASTAGAFPKDTSAARDKRSVEPTPVQKDVEKGTVATGRTRRRRRRNRGSAGGGVDVSMNEIDDEWADSVGCAASAPASSVAAALISATPITVAREASPSSLVPAARVAKGRVLVRGPSDEMSQPVTKRGAAADQLAVEYIKDQRVVIGLLASRPELLNHTAAVVDYVASTQRWRVALGSGEIIAVKRGALRQSIFDQVSRSADGSVDYGL